LDERLGDGNMIKSRRNLILCLCCGLFISASPTLHASTDTTAVGTVSFLIGGPGDVKVQHKGEDDWHPVRLRMPIVEGDIVRTAAESRVEIRLIDDSVLRIGELSELEITSALIKEDSKQVLSGLNKGRLWANVSRLSGRKDEFQIRAPTAVCAVRGTIYRIDADSATTVRVYDGIVDVGPLSKLKTKPETQRRRSLEPVEVPGPYEIPPPYEVTLEEWIRIVRGFQVTVRTDGKYAKSRFDEAEDSRLLWVKWNRERDRSIDR
jgi:hypothetical protein